MTVQAFKWYRRNERVWTDEEEDFVRQNLTHLSSRKIATKLGRTYHSVECKISRMRLTQNAVDLNVAPIDNPQISSFVVQEMMKKTKKHG